MTQPPPRPPTTPTHDAGFTLLELLVVLGIITMLATVAAPQVFRYIGKARTDTARVQIGAIGTALELYALDAGTYPAQQAGLQPLVKSTGDGRWHGPYLKNEAGLTDPWGRPYQYRMPGRNGQPEVFTLGRDNAVGGIGEDADVSN
jgi:general secretion pathway protein G